MLAFCASLPCLCSLAQHCQSVPPQLALTVLMQCTQLGAVLGQPGCQTPFGAAHSVSQQPQSRFCAISKTPLHSQFAKPQHLNVTWDQVLLEHNMAFHIVFHRASPFCRAQPGMGGGEDQAGPLHACAPSWDALGSKPEGEQLPDASISLSKSREDVLSGCLQASKTFCLCRSSSA